MSGTLPVYIYIACLGLSLGLVLGLDWGHFDRDIKFFIYTSFKDFSLDVFDDTHLLHLASDTQRLSFSREFKPTLTLRFNLGLLLGLPWGHFQDIKFFILTSFEDFSLELRRYSSFTFRFRFSTLIVFPGVNSNNNPELSLGFMVRVS